MSCRAFPVASAQAHRRSGGTDSVSAWTLHRSLPSSAAPVGGSPAPMLCSRVSLRATNHVSNVVRCIPDHGRNGYLADDITVRQQSPDRLVASWVCRGRADRGAGHIRDDRSDRRCFLWPRSLAFSAGSRCRCGTHILPRSPAASPERYDLRQVFRFGKLQVSGRSGDLEAWSVKAANLPCPARTRRTHRLVRGAQLMLVCGLNARAEAWRRALSPRDGCKTTPVVRRYLHRARRCVGRRDRRQSRSSPSKGGTACSSSATSSGSMKP